MIHSAKALLSPVVSVDLSACQLKGNSLFSGVLMEFQNQYYVVTSSWAQMSSQWNNTRCEKIWTEIDEIKIAPVVTDHLAGLALYKVLTPIQKLATPSADKSSAQIWTLPDKKLKQADGEIIINGSKRHYIPLWDRVLEWQGQDISSSALGAGVWVGHQWIGLVSHQYLQTIPGAKTKTIRWDLTKELLQNHIIVIPSSYIYTWIQKQISQPEEPILWRPADQQAGIDRWVLGDLEFTTLCPDDSISDPNGEYPIGGNDGFGIGGDSIHNKACKTQVAFSAPDRSSWLPKSLQVWRNQTNTALEQKLKIFLWYGLSRTPNGLTRDYIFSTESLVKISLDSNKKWVDHIQTLSPPTYLESFVQSARILQENSLHCYQKLFIHEASIQELVRRLFFLSILAQSQSWQELSSEDVQGTMDLKGIYSEGWKALQWNATCDTPKIRSLAENFAQTFQNIRKP